MTMRTTKTIMSTLSLLWLALTIDGSGLAYAALLAGFTAAGVVLGAYGALAPGIAAVITYIILSVTLYGSVATVPLLAAVASIVVSGFRTPRGLEALSLMPHLLIALAIGYVSLRAPEWLAAASSLLPGDSGLFLASFLSSKTGVMLTILATFLIASYLVISGARTAAELAISREAPSEVFKSEIKTMLESVEREPLPGYIYWLLGALVASLLSPYFTSLGVIGVAIVTMLILYFRVLLASIINWSQLRIALLTWPLAAAVMLLSGDPVALALSAAGLPAAGYRDPLAGLADPLAEAYVEESLRRALDLAVIAVRLFWGG